MLKSFALESFPTSQPRTFLFVSISAIRGQLTTVGEIGGRYSSAFGQYQYALSTGWS